MLKVHEHDREPSENDEIVFVKRWLTHTLLKPMPLDTATRYITGKRNRLHGLYLHA